MKFNFYISADGPFEVQSVIDFIDWMNDKQRGDITLGDVLRQASGREIGAKDSSKKVDNDSETSKLDPHPAGRSIKDLEREEMNGSPSATPRKNISPGEPAIGKIGMATVAEITKMLNSGQKLPAKFTEHMKLLWKRGEVKFDGKEYYL